MTNKTNQKIDWLNHALEFFVVLIGILIAFQLNTCATSRKQKKTVNTHLDAILKETQYNKGNFEYALSQSVKYESNLDTLIQLILNEGVLTEINKRTLDLSKLSGLYIRENAYSSFIQSGDIRFVKDFEQKKKVIDLYEYYDWVEYFEQASFKQYSENIKPYLIEHLDLAERKVQNKEVYHNRKFVNLLVTYKGMQNAKIRKFKDCIEIVDNYLDSE